MLESSPVRGSSGEGMSTESEGLNRQELRMDVGTQTDGVKLISEQIVGQP